MGGRGKEGRGLPGAERAAVEREQEPPLPLGECERPGGPAGLGAGEAGAGGQAAEGARPPLPSRSPAEGQAGQRRPPRRARRPLPGRGCAAAPALSPGRPGWRSRGWRWQGR